jgi:hypothetical protein
MGWLNKAKYRTDPASAEQWRESNRCKALFNPEWMDPLKSGRGY